MFVDKILSLQPNRDAVFKAVKIIRINSHKELSDINFTVKINTALVLVTYKDKT